MPAQLIDGKAIGTAVRAEIKGRVGEFFSRTGIKPCLVTVLVGDDPASRVYVRNKGKACIEAGMLSRQIDLPANDSDADLEVVLNTAHSGLVAYDLPGTANARD